jgi:Ca-activated chloride channel family protein
MRGAAAAAAPAGGALALAVAALAAAAAAAPPSAGRGSDFSVRITEPREEAFVLGRTRIAAEVAVQGEASVVSVEFRVGEQTIFVDTEPPYQCMHDFGPRAVSWVIQAVARSDDGRTREDTRVTRRLEAGTRVEVSRVILYAAVTARDTDDRFVPDLGRDDFLLEEDGKPQTILDFQLERRPFTVALLIDASGTMKEEMGEVHAAAGGFVEALGDGDQALVVSFSDKVFLLQDLTGDRSLLQRAISSVEAQGPTAWHDALLVVLRRLGREEGRRAVVLLTDGGDTASQASYEDTLERARLSESLVYTIGLGTSGLDLSARSRLKELAEMTGGRAFMVSKEEELRQVYAQILADLRNLYYLTYEPSDQEWNGAWRRISLDVKGRGLKVRTRAGYYGVPPG